MTKRLTQAELMALAADELVRKDAHIARLEDLVNRAGGDLDALPRLTNTPEADLARAPHVSKAIATALDNVKGAKSVPNLFAEAHAEMREDTVKGRNLASRALDRQIHDTAEHVAKQREVGSKIRRDIRREYT